MSEVTTPKADKRKNPHAVKFVPPSAELIAEIRKDNGITDVEIPERKTKNKGTRPGYKLPLATSVKALSGLFNNNTKALLYHGSVTANALTRAYELAHSPEAQKAATITKAKNKVKNMNSDQLDAMIAEAMAKKAALAAEKPAEVTPTA